MIGMCAQGERLFMNKVHVVRCKGRWGECVTYYRMQPAIRFWKRHLFCHDEMTILPNRIHELIVSKEKGEINWNDELR